MNLPQFPKKSIDKKANLLSKTKLAISPEDYYQAQENIKVARQLKQNNQLIEAIQLLEKAINLYPNSAAAYTNLGNILFQQKKLEEAKSCYQKALQIKPNLAPAYANLGAILETQNYLDKAEDLLNIALQINPQYVPALHNLASLYHKRCDNLKAKQILLKTLEYESNYVPALLKLGEIYFQEDDYLAAINNYQKALLIDKSLTNIKIDLGYAYLHICDWDNYQVTTETIVKKIEKHQQETEDILSPSFCPFLLSYFPISLPLHHQAAINYSKSFTQQVAQLKSNYQFSYPNVREGKLKIGYISPDLRMHSVGKLLRQVFGYHNHSLFEIYTYSLANVDDAINREIKENSDYYRELFSLPTEEAAQIINQDGIHILIDLGGYTSHCRPDILALQPAPIQVLFMGYPDTMGADFIQYFLADKWLITEEIAKHYTEEIVYLPNAFVCSSLKVNTTDKTKTDFDLPEDSFVFCCFNKIRKINPEVFAIWMEILKQVPNSVLWLQDNEGFGRENLSKKALKYGIQPDRIVFSSWLSESEYLARYQFANLFLDTFNYNAGSTAIHCLYAGLPILSCAGNTNASRMGASILASVNLEEMICYSPTEYRDKAIDLATHPEKLQAIRESLIKDRNKLPLFDVKSFVANLESKLEELWQEYQSSHQHKQENLKLPIRSRNNSDEDLTSSMPLNQNQSTSPVKNSNQLSEIENFDEIDKLSEIENSVEIKNSVEVNKPSKVKKNSTKKSKREKSKGFSDSTSKTKKSTLPKLSPQEHYDLARQLKKENKLEEAAKHFRQVIKLRPHYAPAYNNLGTTLQGLDKLKEAKSCYQKALSLNPNLAEVHNNLGSVYQVEGDAIKARQKFNLCLQLKPDYAIAWYNLASISLNEGNNQQAKQELEKAIQFNPNYIDALLKLLNVLQDEGYLENAIALCYRILSINPQNADAYIKIAQINEFQFKLEEAYQAYQKALAIAPDNILYKCVYNYCRLKLADWQNYQEDVDALVELTESYLKEGNTSPISPYVMNSYNLSNDLFLKIALMQAQTIETNINKRLNTPQKVIKKRNKIRLGYISPDFRKHAVGRLIQELFYYHNRDLFTIYAYHLLDTDDKITQNIRQSCDYFRNLYQMPALEAAKIIDNDEIDILIDLGGYTIYTRADILALQPAPIQIQFMGYPQTMGAKFIQYILADKWLITPEIAQFYTEEIIYLPNAFISSPQPIADVTMTKDEFDLPKNSFVFCCFNRHDKIEPEGFAIWMKILKEIPNSVLWLSDSYPQAKQNLSSTAIKHGIQAERLIFAPRMSNDDEYLARYQLADVFLDTFIYSAGSTGIAALWAGVPLLTCAGNTNASRMGASLCAAVNLEEMICQNKQEYLEKAIFLAKNQDKLLEIKQKLNQQKEKLPLFNLGEFVENLENILVSKFT